MRAAFSTEYFEIDQQEKVVIMSDRERVSQRQWMKLPRIYNPDLELLVESCFGPLHMPEQRETLIQQLILC